MARPEPEMLRLIALDDDDLAVISANLQDAVVRVPDLAYLPKARRFALLASRFDWAASETQMERCRAGLHFDAVTHAAFTGFNPADAATVLNLLSVGFDPGEAPGGQIVLTFSGGAGIRLKVECIDAQMRDIGPRWVTRAKPGHGIDDEPKAG